jgi:predicted TIM-barrel fold metal-dependent hydrolase
MGKKTHAKANSPEDAPVPKSGAPIPYLSYIIGFSSLFLTVALAGGFLWHLSAKFPTTPDLMKNKQQPAKTAAAPNDDDDQADSTSAQTAPSSLPPVQHKPLRDFKVVNAHEHLMGRKFLPKYLKAAEKIGITNTIFVASSEFTFKGKDFEQTKGNDENSEEVIAAAEENSGKIVPFCTIHPDDPDKLKKLERFVSKGAKGLKLYTGHGSFYKKPLDDPDMTPIYAFCDKVRLPICWHVNIRNYGPEFERVMSKFPNLIVIVPHFGVTFFHPREAYFSDFSRMMDTYPNLFTDTSFGTRAILVDGLEAVSRDPQPFRDFIAKHSDRVLFGTDMVVTGNKEKTVKWIEDVLRVCRQVLEQDTFQYPLGAKGSPYASQKADNVDGVFHGLALDDVTLRKIYETNFDALTALTQR